MAPSEKRKGGLSAALQPFSLITPWTPSLLVALATVGAAGQTSEVEVRPEVTRKRSSRR